MVINLGPQHPSTHGVLRLITELDGEVIRDLHPVIGYLHTGIEKQCENKTYWQAITLVTRMDYLASYFNILAYTTAVEKLLDLTVPDRAQYIRVIMCELNRITSHLVWLGTSGLELGAITMLFYSYREREKALDLGEMIAGERMNTRYFQVGGCADDMPPGFEQRLRAFVDEMPGRIDQYEEMLTQNPIWIDRTKGVGVLPAEQLLDLGVTGPALRAAGVDLDLRKAAPYGGYEHFDFQVPLGTTGDAYDRYTVRMREMRESVRIIGQALDGMPEGSHIADDRKVVLPPRGELLDLHGGADPPLQARHRGLPRARGRGLLGGREPARRDRLLRGRRRLAQAAPRAHARPQLRQPAGAAAHGQGLLPGRPDHDDRVARQRDGGCGPLVTVEEITAHIEPIRHEYAEARSLILPALKFAQTEKGHLTPEDLEAVAQATGFTAAYVESVASFYDRIYLRPTGERVVSVCVTLSCMLRGSDELLEHMCDREGLAHHGGTSEDGAITIQEAQCLGYCDRAPCVQVDAQETQGPLSLDDADRLLDELRSTPRPERLWR